MVNDLANGAFYDLSGNKEEIFLVHINWFIHPHLKLWIDSIRFKYCHMLNSKKKSIFKISQLIIKISFLKTTQYNPENNLLRSTDSHCNEKNYNNAEKVGSV
jgi:hypothetical protein